MVAVCSKTVILSLFIVAPIVWECYILFCDLVLSDLSGLTIIALRKTELVALLQLYNCIIAVV